MPLYSYHCAKCDKDVELLIRLFRHARLSNLRQPRAGAPGVSHGAGRQEPQTRKIRAGAGGARGASEQL